MPALIVPELTPLEGVDTELGEEEEGHVHLCTHEDNYMPSPQYTNSYGNKGYSAQRALGSSHKIGKCMVSKQVVGAKEDEGSGPYPQFSHRSSGDENL